MASSAVAHSLIAASISSNIATDKATISAAGVASVKQACIIRHLLDFHSAGACFYDHVHSIGVHFDNLIHAL